MPRNNGDDGPWNAKPVPHPDPSQDPTRGTQWAPNGDSGNFGAHVNHIADSYTSTRLSWDGDSNPSPPQKSSIGCGIVVPYLIGLGVAAGALVGARYGS